MPKAPAFQFYAAEYLADEDVQLMTLEEEGCYIRLLAYCWREGSIPADHEKISRLCKGASTTAVRVVAKCFDLNPSDSSRMHHKRLEEERRKQADWRAKSSNGGKKGAETRAKNRGSRTVVEPPLQPLVNTAFASSSLSSLNTPPNPPRGAFPKRKSYKPSEPGIYTGPPTITDEEAEVLRASFGGKR